MTLEEDTMSANRGLEALVVLSLGAAACGGKVDHPPVVTEVTARPARGDLPKSDPGSDLWASAPELIVKLLPQDQAMPKLEQPSVESVRVRALHDGTWLALRLEWDDPTKDALVGAARFGDMAAVQVPVDGGANVPDGAMGQTGRPVRLSLWRASNDHLLSSKVDAVGALYPNALPDHYPFRAAGESAAALERQYSPAKAAGNIVAVRRADSPTEDLVAEGFGSLSVADPQVSLGRGLHDGRSWRVVISLPLDRREGEALVLGGRTYVAFAVWDGAKDNVGSRKMRSAWVPLSLGVKP